jgi:hypothetical protein
MVDLDKIISEVLHSDPGNGYQQVARAAAAAALRWAAGGMPPEGNLVIARKWLQAEADAIERGDASS